MKQREVTDKENTRWTCVQAYGGMQGKLSEKATELATDDQGKVTVICTPSGGARTVRLELEENWIDEKTDNELLDAIAS